MMSSTQPVRGPLRSESHELFWNIAAATAAFGCYFSMYAFRKPFTAAAFADTALWNIGFKTILVTSQVFGYLFAKFLGIKVVAEIAPQYRARSIVKLILFAEVSLVAFGLMPRPLNAICLFFNGLSLGMVFGLVLGFLEGRRMTEALTAGLCASFILADGATKSVGSWLLHLGVAEDWMPSLAGALFLPVVGLCVAVLSRVPPPGIRDIAARAERVQMDADDRRHFLRRHSLGLLPLIVMYLLVTIVRSIRADFAPELWKELGSEAAPSTFTQSEMWVALAILIVNGGMVFLRDNRQAFFLSLVVCGAGIILMGASIYLQQHQQLDSFPFMVLIGLGLYLPYVAMQTTVLERLLAMTPERGNLGFLIYVADTVGYLGFVCVMLTRNFVKHMSQVLPLLQAVGWLTVVVSAICLIVSAAYFLSWRPTASRVST